MPYCISRFVLVSIIYNKNNWTHNGILVENYRSSLNFIFIIFIAILTVTLKF